MAEVFAFIVIKTMKMVTQSALNVRNKGGNNMNMHSRESLESLMKDPSVKEFVFVVKEDKEDTVKNYVCPNCGDLYKLHSRYLNEGLTICWKCHKPYLQRVCTTETPEYIRRAVHRVKGE